MDLAVVVLAGVLLAALAPLVHGRIGSRAGVVLALYPLGVAIYLLAQAGPIWRGQTVESTLLWAPSLGLELRFLLDGLSLLFGLLISGIGALILVYAGAYLKGHEHLGRMLSFLLLFMASMLGLVLADNVIALFVFWEGTSISSYLLIGFNHRQEESRASALQALIVTGGGGLALLAGLVLLGIIGGSFDLSTLNRSGPLIQASPFYTGVLILILAGAFTKSAQFPFHFWLPGAMAAPTPVSAYLHSATMVKAGIYLMARLFPALGGTDLWFWALTGAGALTMVTGGVLALLQTDLKRLLAYSTVSALGTLTLLLGVGTDAALKAFAAFLLAHALYKGALFMIAGTLDHETGTRDVERLGGLARLMPITASMGVLAAVSLAGIAPFFAFIGKELMFEAVLEAQRWRAPLIVVAVFSGAIFVAVAAMVGIKPFFGARPPTPKTPHEAPPGLWLGFSCLAVLGLLLGLVPRPASLLLSQVVSAVGGRPVELDLYLWHGFNAALGLSVLSVLLGAASFWLWSRFRLSYTPRAQRFDLGPARGFTVGLAGLMTLARVQTALLQNGYLRFYVLCIVVFAIGVVGLTLARAGGGWAPLPPLDARFYEVTIALMIAGGALVSLRSLSRLAALAALGVVGFCVALIFLFFGAPDLALTQILVDTLTVILFVLVFYHLPHFARWSSTAARVRDAVIAGTFGLMVSFLVLQSNAARVTEPVSEFHVANSLPKAYGRNIVNVILVDFRALDTLGEIVVLALAGLGVFSLLRLRLHPPAHTEANSAQETTAQANSAQASTASGWDGAGEASASRAVGGGTARLGSDGGGVG